MDDQDEFEYIEMNDDNINDISQTEIAKITQAMSAQADQGKPVFERKQVPNSIASKQEYAKSALMPADMTKTKSTADISS